MKRRSKFDARSAFENDYDRVVFSSAFRRLRNKAQVFSLEAHDYVRTRLTHSVEVSTIGRALGEGVAKQLKLAREFDLTNQDVGTIVATACLLHDIGNPPFGHSGESAIGSWFAEEIDEGRLTITDPQEKHDLTRFEGNAQAFRIATRTQWNGTDYGMNLTAATLATLVKYPCPSNAVQWNGPKSRSKFGFFKADTASFDRVRSLTGLSGYRRHPLTFLVEAADDIAYAVGDIEDVLKKGVIDYATIHGALIDQVRTGPSRKVRDFLETAYSELDIGLGPKERQQLALQRFSQMAIRMMAKSAIEAFVDRGSDIMGGSFDGELVKEMELASLHQTLRSLMDEHVYSHVDIAHREQGARSVIHGLLGAITDELGERPDGALAQSVYREAPRNPGDRRDLSESYFRSLRATDYVSGMTDGFALSQYQRISGMSTHL